ncbi:unnamed protein product [Rotaria sp. Silwood2]|nr:unnamed protein product [Rotaria sp. Silwood2]
MVAIARSAAACQQQSPNTNNVVLSAGVSKVYGKKKKVAKQRAPSPNKSSSTQPVLTTTTTTITPEIFDNISLITPTSLSEIELSHHQNNYHVNAITNDAEQCLDLPSTSFNSNNSNQDDDLCELDDDKELDTLTSWPVAIGEIEWCKTNRGNDRLCCSYYAEHNHPPNYHHTKRLLVLQKVKDRVLLEPTPVTRITEDEYIKNNLNNEDRCHFLLPQAQASRYYKIRAKLLPPNPKSLDFELPASYSTTHEGENFLLYDSTHKKLGGRLMILSSKYLIQMLCSCDVMLIDGTFKIRPSMFSQVDVIMGQHLDEVGAAIDYLIDNPPLSHILLIEFNEYFRKQWIDRIPIKY